MEEKARCTHSVCGLRGKECGQRGVIFRVTRGSDNATLAAHYVAFGVLISSFRILPWKSWKKVFSPIGVRMATRLVRRRQ